MTWEAFLVRPPPTVAVTYQSLDDDTRVQPASIRITAYHYNRPPFKRWQLLFIVDTQHLRELLRIVHKRRSSRFRARHLRI